MIRNPLLWQHKNIVQLQLKLILRAQSDLLISTFIKISNNAVFLRDIDFFSYSNLVWLHNPSTASLFVCKRPKLMSYLNLPKSLIMNEY